MPDGIAFVLTSSNERGGVPFAKKRFPVVLHIARSGHLAWPRSDTAGVLA